MITLQQNFLKGFIAKFEKLCYHSQTKKEIIMTDIDSKKLACVIARTLDEQLHDIGQLQIVMNGHVLPYHVVNGG